MKRPLERFEFKDCNGKTGHCRLRVWEEEDHAPVVIATEVDDNAAMSVTNAAELIATQAWRFLERPAAGIVYIENYQEKEDKRLARSDESFDRVTFTQTQRGFVHPQWKYMMREDVERVIGQPI